MPATGPKNITVKALKAALRKHSGVYVLAAQELGCDRTNIAQRVKRSPELQAYVEQIDDEVGDVAVAVIHDALLKKDRTMARWYADRKLKHRGFTTRVEHTGKDGGALAPAAVIHVETVYVEAQPQPEGSEDVI